MTGKFSLVLSFLSLILAVLAGCATEPAANAVAETAKPVATAERPKTPLQRARDLAGELNGRSKRASTTEIVAALEDFIAKEPDCTNRAVRLSLEGEILRQCSRSSGISRSGTFEEDVAKAAIDRVGGKILADESNPLADRVNAARFICRLLCNDEKYAEAEKVAKGLTSVTNATPQVRGSTWRLVMDVERWADKYPEALAAGKEAIKLHWGNVEGVCELADEYGHPEEIEKLWAIVGDLQRELSWGYSSNVGRRIMERPEMRGKFRAKLFAYVTDEKVDLKRRAETALNSGLLLADDELGQKASATFNDYDFTKMNAPWSLNTVLPGAYHDGNWAKFVRLYERFGGMKAYGEPKFRRAYALSLAYLGRKNEAVAYAGKCLAEADDNLAALDKAKYEVIRAVVAGKDALAAIEAFGFGVKDRAEAVKFAGQVALNLTDNAACERYSAAYQGLFKPIPRREVAVKFFAQPITSITAWRQVYDELEKTWVDVKMCGDLDRLDTDVATGRTIAGKTEHDNKTAMMEVTTLCDVQGVSVFLRVEDPNARMVENGFANGLGTEAYFAPGPNQPYLCFGTAPRTGLDTFAFHTTYTGLDSHRLNVKGALDRNSVRSEVEFTDADYVVRIFFPWDAFYQKLPVRPGDYWKLDFLCWGTKTSWGGSQGVHESSSWGHLVFNLKAEEVTAIRKRLVLGTYKNWKGTKSGEVDIFDRWADPVLGDPDFYAARLKPLEDELAAYAKRVKPEMTDADVNDVFVHALPRWMGLKYEIDALRRDWLLERNAEL